VDLDKISKLPEIEAAIVANHVNSSYDLYRMFIARMDSYAQRRNRTLHVWEGFAPQAGQSGKSTHPASSVVIPTSVVVEPFDCYYYNPPQLAMDGYQVCARRDMPQICLTLCGHDAPAAMYHAKSCKILHVHTFANHTRSQIRQ